MARMIPAAAPSDAPASERRVFEKLKSAPGADEWTVFHSIALSSAHTGQFGEIDFLVLIPRHGMICIEVKGGGVAVRNGNWTTTNAQGVTSTLKRSPFAQAKEGMWKLRQTLEARFGRNSHEFRCPIGWIAILPDVACPPPNPEFVRQEAIDASDLDGDIAATILRAPSLLGASSQPGKVPPSDHVCRSIGDFLRPSFERPELAGTRAWDAERKLIELSAEQFDVLESLFDNDCVLVHGAAGTGKTVLALESARRHAAAGRSVLLTCFNRRLGDWMAAECKAFGPGPVAFGHLHKVLRKDLMASQFVTELSQEEPDYGRAFFTAAALAQVDVGRTYDVVIVDEAQDFDPGLLSEVLAVWRAGGNCPVLLFGDFSRQAIYDACAKSTQEIKAALGPFASFALTVNRRNTRRIVRTIESVTGVTGARASERAPEGDPVVTSYFDGQSDLVAKVGQRLGELRAAGFSASDAVVLGPRRLENSSLAGQRRLGGFEFGPLDANRTNAVGYSTIHSFKGMERKVVLIVDVSVDAPAASDALLYVGMSRAKRRLFLFVEAAAKPRLDARILEHMRTTLGNATQAG
jgi:hypothetical protein